MASSFIKKGTDPAGTAVGTETIVDGITTVHLQRMVLVDLAGVQVGASAAGVAPAKVSVTNAAVATLLSANGTRMGFRIIHEGPDLIVVGLTNPGLATLQTNGAPLYATQIFETKGIGVYRGAVYACCRSGLGPTNTYVMEW